MTDTLLLSRNRAAGMDRGHPVVTIAVRPFRPRSTMSLLPPVIPPRLSGGVDALREVPDLLQDPELVLERQDFGDLAVLEVPDRRVAHLDGLAGRCHAAIRAGMGSAPHESHGELVSRDKHVLDARRHIREARQPVADPADRP